MAEASGGSSMFPLPEITSSDVTERRLWIGNLDTRVTEFVLLKILQKYGKLEKFDFLYHKTGPDKGKSRGYCFASYSNKEEAEKAMRGLDGKLALSKRLSVRWAHLEEENQDAISVPKVAKRAEEQREPQSTDSKIRAIEAKLRSMERGQKDFSLSLAPEAPPGSSKYSCLARAPSTLQGHQNTKKPYNRNNRR